MPPEAVDLVSRLLQYSPNLRSSAVSILLSSNCVSPILCKLFSHQAAIFDAPLQVEALAHPFFDELRDPNAAGVAPNARLPNGRPLPPLFNFKAQGNRDYGVSATWDQSTMLSSIHVQLPNLFCYFVLPMQPATELRAVPADLLPKLIPEHVRRQCPSLAIWYLGSFCIDRGSCHGKSQNLVEKVASYCLSV